MSEHLPQTSPPPASWARTTTGDAELPRPGSAFGGAAQWGLASLLIGCTLVLLNSSVMLFTMELFYHGGFGFGVALEIVCALPAVVAVAGLGVAGVVFGLWGCRPTPADRSSPAFGVAGLITSALGLAGWIIAGIHLLVVLFHFA